MEAYFFSYSTSLDPFFKIQHYALRITGVRRNFSRGGKVDILFIIFRFLTVSGVNDGGANHPLGKLNINIGPLLSLYCLYFG